MALGDHRYATRDLQKMMMMVMMMMVLAKRPWESATLSPLARALMTPHLGASQAALSPQRMPPLDEHPTLGGAPHLGN